LMIVNGGYPAGNTNRAAAIAWGLQPGQRRSVQNFHNFAVPPKWWDKWIENPIDAMVNRYTRTFVAPSKICAQSIRIRPVLAASDKIGFIFNGTQKVPDQINKSSSLKQRLGIANADPVCCLLATYEPRKGHDFLLQAFAKVLERVPNAHLIIAGYGLAFEVRRVEGLVEDLQLTKNVHLLDFSMDTQELYEAMDILVAPSQSFESFGLTLIEAMSHKLPIVATRVGGMVEVMGEDEAGFSVDCDDENSFADKLVSLMTDEVLRKQKGRDGYQRYLDHFTVERMVDAHARLVRNEDDTGLTSC